MIITMHSFLRQLSNTLVAVVLITRKMPWMIFIKYVIPSNTRILNSLAFSGSKYERTVFAIITKFNVLNQSEKGTALPLSCNYSK